MISKIKVLVTKVKAYLNEGIEDTRFDDVHKTMTTKIIIPAIGIPSALLILASFKTDPTVIFAILMHILLASTNIFLTNQNRIFNLFGRVFRSRDNRFDFWRWMINMTVFDPILFYLLSPTQSVHFACWTMLTVAALIDTYKKSYRLRVVSTSAVMFFASHAIIFPEVGVVENVLLTSVLCSFVFVMWAIESRFLVSMINAAEKSEFIIKQNLEIEKMEAEAAFGQHLRLVSHEINNILTVLSTANPAKHPEIVQRAVSKLKTISTLILDGSSGSRQKMKTSVKTLLEEIKILVRPIATHAGLRWVETVDENLQDETFEEFTGASFLIIQNFVKNASEELAVKGGTVSLGVKRVDDRIVLSVGDDGDGLSKSPFLDIESNVTTKKSGHGIGLKFVHREAIKSGFDVGCDPGPKRGALFWISIPLSADSRNNRSESDYLMVQNVIS
jgi:signal transduction histidine kinase